MAVRITLKYDNRIYRTFDRDVPYGRGIEAVWDELEARGLLRDQLNWSLSEKEIPGKVLKLIDVRLHKTDGRVLHHAKLEVNELANP